MSAVSMADLAMAKRMAAVGVAPPAPAGLPAGAHGPAPVAAPPPDNPVMAALKLITTYIPTEILTLYVAAVAIVLPGVAPGNPTAPAPNYRAAWVTFFVFLVLTPIVNWLVYAAKLKAAGQGLPLHPADWPKWEMFVAAVAYVAWAAALPTTPFITLTAYGYSTHLAGYLVLVVTTFLGLLTAVFK